MTPDSSGDAPLDFSTSASPDTASATCAACKRPILDQYWSAGEAVVCGDCKAAVERGQQATPDVMSRAARFSRAALYGAGATVVGALIWYAVARLLNLEIGLIAILLGYLVGRAVFLGSGKRGGRRYQILAVFLTYLGIGLAYAPFALEALRESSGAEADSARAAPSADSLADAGEPAPAPGTAGEPSVTPGGNPDAAGFLLAVGVLLLGILTLPVVISVGGLPGSLISLLIYGFAIVQAWRLTASATVAFTGPFRVGGISPA